MVKEQYIKFFSFLIGITLIISGVIYTFTKTYKDEKKEKVLEESAIADEIGDVYKTFFDKEEEISKYSEDLNEEMLEYVSFYTTMPDGYKEIYKKVEDYETYVKEVEDISSYLKDKCRERYSSVDANEKCNAYYINLEKTINIHIGIVKYFNTKIDEYNVWTEKENESVGSTVKYDKLEKYTSKFYTEYVDLNEDGTFLGMNND